MSGFRREMETISYVQATGIYRNICNILAQDGYRHRVVEDPNGSWKPKDRCPTYVGDLIGMSLLVASEPVPADFSGSRLDPEQLRGTADRLQFVLKTLENVEAGTLPSVDWRILESEASLLLEPFTAKLMMIIEPEALTSLLLKKKAPSLPVLLEFLTEFNCSPLDDELLKLESSEFTNPEGWNSRDTLSNSVRQVLGARIVSAHLAPAPQSDVAICIGWSALVLLLALVEHNYGALSAELSQHSYVPQRLSPRPASRTDNLPAHRQPEPEVVSISVTRKVERARFCERIRQLQRDGRGGLLEVGDPPGWGKTHFIMMALQNCDCRVSVIDLLDCADMHDVAERLLNGIAVCAEEISYVDANPLAAVEFLTQRFLPGGVIVLENCHASEREVQTHLPKLIRRLIEKGLIVIAEAWSYLRGCSPDYRSQLSSLSDAEVALWAELVLERPPDPECELFCLEALDGYPALIKATLSAIRNCYPKHPGSAEAVLELAIENLEYLDVREEWLRFATGDSVTTGRTVDLAPDWIFAAFAMIPWGMLPRSELDATLDRQLERLVPLHLIQLSEDGKSWCRMPALWALSQWSLTHLKESHPKAVALARVLASTTDKDRVQRTSRYCVSLVTRGLIDTETCDSLLGTLPTEELPEVCDTEFYDAPTAIPTQELDTSELPVQTQLSIVEGYLRRGVFNEHQRIVQHSLDSFFNVVTEDDLRGSLCVRTLHQVLLRIPDSEMQNSAYRAAITRMPTPESLPDATLTWWVRLIVFASEAAFRLGNRAQGEEWRKQSYHLLTISSERIANRNAVLTVDTHYRLIAGGHLLASCEKELAQVHLSAISFISRNTNAADQRWMHRWFGHFSALVRITGWSDEWEQILLHHIAEWPADGSATDLLIRVLDLVDLAPDADKCVARVAKALAVPRHHRSGEFARRVHELLTSPAVAIPQEVKRLKNAFEVAEPATAPTTEELLLGALLAALSQRFPDAATGWRGEVTNIAATLPSLVLQAPPLIRHYTTRHALNALLENEGSYLEHVVGQLDRQAASGRIPQVVFRSFDKIAKVLDAALTPVDPKLWPHVTNLYIRLDKLESKHLPSPQVRAKFAKRVEDRMRNHVRAANAQLSPGPSLYLTRYEIHRHLWMFTDALDDLESLTNSSSSEDDFATIGDHLLIRLLPLFLSNPLVRSAVSCNTEQQNRARRLFLRLVKQAARPFDQELYRHLLWVVKMLESESDPDAWRALLAYYHSTIRRPWEFWDEVQISIGDNETALSVPDRQEEVGAGILGDLTDSSRLRIASALACYGASIESLSDELRFELAEFAVFAAFGADRWNRSRRNESSMASRWRVGTALAIALAHSADDRIFGMPFSPLKRRRTQEPKPWRELALDYLSVSAVGAFKQHVSEVAVRLREVLRKS